MHNEILIGVLGFVASVVSFVMFLPQAITVWKFRKQPEFLKGTSRWGQWFLLLNASLWGLYAYLTGAYWSGAPGLFNGPLAIITLVLLHKASQELKLREVKDLTVMETA